MVGVVERHVYYIISVLKIYSYQGRGRPAHKPHFRLFIKTEQQF